MENIKRCTRCVMDNRSDQTITFDENGYCNYCTEALSRKDKVYFPNEIGQKKLEEMIVRLKRENKNNKYDCLMGISGGLDSSYLAYLGAAKWGLRILAVHIDDGFDEEVAVRNIQKLCQKTTIDLKVVTPNAEQFNDLTRALFFAGVPNLAAPQDNVLFECLYSIAKQTGVRSFLSGGNFALESILQRGNTHDAFDKKNIMDIHRRFGRVPLKDIRLLSNQRLAWDKYILKIETLKPLDYIDYNRERAIQELYDFCGFAYYGSKHLENKLTKFIQLYYFYHKFGVDKRTSHLSSMIVSDQMTREKALEELEKPLYDEAEMQRDIRIVMDKLQISQDEFDRVMHEAPKQHSDYKTSSFNERKRSVGRMLRKLHLKK